MGLKIGDTFFNRDGRPGLVVGREGPSAKLVIEQEGARAEKSRKYGYINGLSPEDRVTFESIIDKVRESPDSDARVAHLQAKLEEYHMDANKQALSRYLEGELSHMMNSDGLRPRVYKVDSDQI